MWWWGQAQGFAEQDACVAFAGGEVSAGPFRTKVTALVVRLPDGTLLRLGNPGTSPVRAMITDDSWVLIGRSRFWQVELEGHAQMADALVLPVPPPISPVVRPVPVADPRPGELGASVWLRVAAD
jgi:tocopherol cyclase